MRIEFIFAWYDFWVGLFWDRKKRFLYILPIPCMGVVIKFDRYYEMYSTLTNEVVGVCTDEGAIYRPGIELRPISKKHFDRFNDNC